MTQNESAIELQNVRFYYETPLKKKLMGRLPLPISWVKTVRHTALKDINLRIKRNRITALLGRNGSGKTTLIKIITGARLPQQGKVSVFGRAPRHSRYKVGLCMGATLIYYRLTARENLEYFGKLYGVERLAERIEELAETVGLTEHLDQIVESFSFGMKVKLALIRSMIHSPDLLILDEPTLGIDLHLAEQLRDFIRQLQCTVLVTTHYMEEAEILADDLCIIDQGNIIDHGTKQEIFNRYNANNVPEVFLTAIGQDGISELLL